MRKLISLTLTVSLLFLVLDALVLYLAPSAQIATWTNWRVLGLGKASWTGMHVSLGFLILVCGIWHLVLNWRAVTGYLRDTSRQLSLTSPAALGALGLVLFVQLGALLGLPPMQQLIDISNYAKASHARNAGDPPYPQAEQSPSDVFAKRTGLDADRALAIFTARGVRVDSTKQTLAEIAKQNGLSPANLFDLAQGKIPSETRAEAPKAAGNPLPSDPPPGLGMLKLTDVAEQYGLDLEAMLRLLSAKGIKAAASMTVRDAAAIAGVQTYDIYEIMRLAPLKAAGPAPSQAQQTAPLTPQPHAAPQAPATAPSVAAPTTPALQAVPAPMPVPTAPVVEPTQPAAPPVQASGPKKAPPDDYQRIFLSQLATYYGLTTTEAVARLESKRFSAFGDMTIREIALENGIPIEQVLAIVAAGQ